MVQLGMTMTKSKLTILQTVYPPISNSLAYQLEKDPEVEARFRESDFYMIAARAEARLREPEIDQKKGTLSFDFIVGALPPVKFIIDLLELPGLAQLKGSSFHLEFDGEGRGFRIWSDEPHAEGSELLEWFTTESLLWHASRRRPGIRKVKQLRELSTFDLLYVGIAKTGDSFDRLFGNGHTARTNILANEPQRYPGARPSDETFLFLFKAEPVIMTTFELDHEFTDEDLSGDFEAKRIVADAEKAFVSLLKPEYNITRFKSYPKGADGLYGQGYDRYGYAIGEEFAFNTAHGSFRGGVDANGMISAEADAIFVEGDAVRLFKSGMDFSASGPE